MWSLLKVKRPPVLSHSSKKSTHEIIKFLSNLKNLNLGPSWPNRTFKYWASSIFLLYDFLISCKKSEKTDEAIPRPCIVKGRANWQMDQGTEPNSVDISTTAVVQYYWLIWLSIHNQQELIAIVPMPLKVEGHCKRQCNNLFLWEWKWSFASYGIHGYFFILVYHKSSLWLPLDYLDYFAFQVFPYNINSFWNNFQIPFFLITLILFSLGTFNIDDFYCLF